MSAITAKLQNVSTTLQQALDSDNSQAYSDARQLFGELESAARETFQANLKKKYIGIVHKLEGDQPLSAEEDQLLKLLIVGEAKYYVQSVGNLEGWRTDLQKLLREVESIEADGADSPEKLLQIQAICRQARSVLPDITFYFKEKERLEKFEMSTSGPLDKETREILANIIRSMLESDTM